MFGVGLFVVWVGYSVAYYGFDQIRGGNNGLLSLMVPGKYSAQPPDTGSTAPKPTAATQGTVGSGGVAPTKQDPSGTAVWWPTSPPAGAPAGNYRVDQDGDIERQVGGVWVPYKSATGQTGVGATIGGKPTPYGA